VSVFVVDADGSVLTEVGEQFSGGLSGGIKHDRAFLLGVRAVGAYISGISPDCLVH
jgi:hypothetical protein